MTLRRGDLVNVAAKGPYTAKPRPALVIQASETLPYRDSVPIGLFTTELVDASLFRVRIQPTRGNALSKPSDVMADKVLTVPKTVISEKAFGKLSNTDLDRVDAALRFWLSL